MSNPRLAFRVHPAIEEAAKKAAVELKVPLSELLRHCLIVGLAGLSKLPKLGSGSYYGRDHKSRRILEKLNDRLPAVENWPSLIPEELTSRVDTWRF